MSKPSLVIVLAEDVCHQRFIRHCLKQQNYERHQMSFEPIPGSRGGDAVKWVIERYAKEVQAFRTRSARAGTALIVAIDADTETVEHRTRHLARALAEGGLGHRAGDERIVHLIPKRNVETWILCLTGELVNEDADYKPRRDIKEKIKPAAHEFFAWSRPNATPPPNCIPSLQAAIPEVRRLE